MMQVWRPLLFSDEELETQATRDPVSPAERSASAHHKAASKVLPHGTPAHSFRNPLLQHLSTRVRNACRPFGAGSEASTFTLDTLPDPIQSHAYELLKTLQM
jgi:hypothetical protein